MLKIRGIFWPVALGMAVFISTAAQASGFGVAPIRLDFDRTSKTGLIEVSNDDTRPLSFQMKLFAWSQDAEGKDQYQPSNDLIFFPQIMSLKPKEKRPIRVGTKGPPAASERAYRLFIEELPDPAETAAAKAPQIAVRIRFGVPLFVAPAQPQIAGVIEDAKLAKGEIQLRVRNTGNRNFQFETVAARAGTTSIGETRGWYLFPGIARAYSIKVDSEACAKAKTLEVHLSADGLELKHELEATPTLCRP